MTYTEPTEDLLREIEPEAGDIMWASKHRPRTEFDPDWHYIASSAASTKAVVAALRLGYDVPEHVWDPVLRTHCPTACAWLDQAGVTAQAAITGRAPVGVMGDFAHRVNRELDGYQVLMILDSAAMLATVIGELGAVPTFEDPHA